MQPDSILLVAHQQLSRMSEAQPLGWSRMSTWTGACCGSIRPALIEAVRARSTPRLLAALQIIFGQHHPA